MIRSEATGLLKPTRIAHFQKDSVSEALRLLDLDGVVNRSA